MAEDFYTELEKTINVLVTDDDPEQLNFYEEMLSAHPLFNIKKATTAARSEQILRESQAIHLCILDFGINDVKNDEYYLIKKYSTKVPIIVISGSADMERAFKASQLGAAALIAKPVDFNSRKFWDTLSSVFLNQKILPSLTNISNPVLIECCKVIQNDPPETVSDWAAVLNITDTYLRRIWNECCNQAPKHVLFLYKLYRDALMYYNSTFLADLTCTKINVTLPEIAEYRRMINYYLLNKNELDLIRD